MVSFPFLHQFSTVPALWASAGRAVPPKAFCTWLPFDITHTSYTHISPLYAHNISLIVWPRHGRLCVLADSSGFIWLASSDHSFCHCFVLLVGSGKTMRGSTFCFCFSAALISAVPVPVPRVFKS